MRYTTPVRKWDVSGVNIRHQTKHKHTQRVLGDYGYVFHIRNVTLDSITTITGCKPVYVDYVFVYVGVLDKSGSV